MNSQKTSYTNTLNEKVKKREREDEKKRKMKWSLLDENKSLFSVLYMIFLLVFCHQNLLLDIFTRCSFISWFRTQPQEQWNMSDLSINWGIFSVTLTFPFPFIYTHITSFSPFSFSHIPTLNFHHHLWSYGRCKIIIMNRKLLTEGWGKVLKKWEL
jgi:hypothetical protein